MSYNVTGNEGGEVHFIHDQVNDVSVGFWFAHPAQPGARSGFVSFAFAFNSEKNFNKSEARKTIMRNASIGRFASIILPSGTKICQDTAIQVLIQLELAIANHLKITNSGSPEKKFYGFIDGLITKMNRHAETPSPASGIVQFPKKADQSKYHIGDSRVRFFHSSAFGVSVGFHPNDTPGIYTVAFAVCSEKDQFTKSISRDIIMKRLRSSGAGCFEIESEMENFTYRGALEEIFKVVECDQAVQFFRVNYTETAREQTSLAIGFYLATADENSLS